MLFVITSISDSITKPEFLNSKTKIINSMSLGHNLIDKSIAFVVKIK